MEIQVSKRNVTDFERQNKDINKIKAEYE